MATPGVARELAPGRSWLGLGLSRSSYRRLEAGVTDASLELERRRGSGTTAWATAAEHALERARSCLLTRDIEGGWGALHAAGRYLAYGMSEEELSNQRIALRNESQKLTPWRAASMREILGEDTTPVSAARVVAAMAVRDEYSATQYHKIWMTGDQIKLLALICIIGLAVDVIVAYIPSTFLPKTSLEFSLPRMVSIAFLALLAASLSALRGLIAADVTMKIPERVANYFTTIARLLSGVIAGIIGYIFVIEGLLPWIDVQRIHPYLSVPILFGIAGERIVMSVVNSVTSPRT